MQSKSLTKGKPVRTNGKTTTTTKPATPAPEAAEPQGPPVLAKPGMKAVVWWEPYGGALRGIISSVTPDGCFVRVNDDESSHAGEVLPAKWEDVELQATGPDPAALGKSGVTGDTLADTALALGEYADALFFAKLAGEFEKDQQAAAEAVQASARALLGLWSSRRIDHADGLEALDDLPALAITQPGSTSNNWLDTPLLPAGATRLDRLIVAVRLLTRLDLELEELEVSRRGLDDCISEATCEMDMEVRNGALPSGFVLKGGAE